MRYFTDTEIPTRWGKLIVSGHRYIDPRAVGTRRLILLIPTCLTTDQSEDWSPADSLQTITIKLLTTHSRVRHTVLKALACCGPPLPGKAIKSYFFLLHPKLSPRLNSVLGYRGQIWLQYLKDFDLK